MLFAILLLLAAIIAFPQCRRSTQATALALFALGALCLWSFRGNYLDWSVALTANGGLVVLFIALPLFSFLLNYNDYIGSVGKLFQVYVRKPHWFFTLIAVFAGLLGAVMNLAGMTLMDQLLRPSLPKFGKEKHFTQALSRGNLSMSYWAPCHMSVATVITYTGISWLELAPRGILLSLLQLLVIALFFFINVPKHKEEASAVLASTEPLVTFDKKDRKIIAELLVVYVGLIIWVAIFNWQTNLPILAIITITAYSYPLLVALWVSKTAGFKKDWQQYIRIEPKISNQVLLFSSVGFFGKALALSGIGDRVIQLIGLDNITSPILLIAGIALVMVFLSMIGIHPLVSMITLATTLRPELLGISSLSLAYTYLLGYSVGVVVSPFSAVALTMSALNGQDPWNGLTKYNIVYGIVLIALFACIISFI
jgi:hypothetical protein